MHQFGEAGFQNSFEKLMAPATYEFYLAIQATNPNFEGDDVIKVDRFLAPELRSIKDNLGTYLEVAERHI